MARTLTQNSAAHAGREGCEIWFYQECCTKKVFSETGNLIHYGRFGLHDQQAELIRRTCVLIGIIIVKVVLQYISNKIVVM